MKKIRPILFIFFLLIIYIYTAYITLFPSNIILFEGEEINYKKIFAINVKQENSEHTDINYDSNILQTATNISSSRNGQISKANLSLNLFDSIPLKQVEVDYIKKTKVIPMGNAIGLKLYTNGVMVVGMSEVKGLDQKVYKPYEKTDLKEGDLIVEVDDKAVSCISELIESVNASQGKNIKLKYLRESGSKITTIDPVETDIKEYKLGLWVRDAGGGVGTLTFYEPESDTFCALGHGISDVDTGDILNIARGELVTTNIVAITKGEKGKPGEVKGTIENGENVGKVLKNTMFGIYGRNLQKSKLNVDVSDAMEIATRSEVVEGEAEIICQLENGKKEKYKIEIEKIYTSNNYDNKSMIIRIKDDKLIKKTGGIIQGMSGSPIIQNGKFVGAVTHVLVNDPTQGYAVFADMMIKQMREVE